MHYFSTDARLISVWSVSPSPPSSTSNPGRIHFHSRLRRERNDVVCSRDVHGFLSLSFRSSLSTSSWSSLSLLCICCCYTRARKVTNPLLYFIASFLFFIFFLFSYFVRSVICVHRSVCWLLFLYLFGFVSDFWMIVVL